MVRTVIDTASPVGTNPFTQIRQTLSTQSSPRRTVHELLLCLRMLDCPLETLVMAQGCGDDYRIGTPNIEQIIFKTDILEGSWRQTIMASACSSRGRS